MVKKLNEWVSHVHELTANQKNCRFAVSMFFYSTWTIFRLDCDVWWIVDFILQPGMTRLVVGPRNSKALSKAKLAPKKVTWWSSTSLIHYSFLNPGETMTSGKYAQQIDEMHQKLQRLQPALVNRKGPILLHNNAQPHVIQPMLLKLNEVLLHPPYSPDISPIDYCFLQASWQLFQGKCFHNQHDAENAFQEFTESQSMDFYTTGISYLISHWQECVDCNDSYFD